MKVSAVFVRKVTQRNDEGILASERLDLTIDQENRRVGFGFTSRIQGVADLRGHVAFPGDSEDTELSHSSGKITRETLNNMNAFQALLERLDTCCASGMTDGAIRKDKVINTILRQNRFEEIKF